MKKSHNNCIDVIIFKNILKTKEYIDNDKSSSERTMNIISLKFMSL